LPILKKIRRRKVQKDRPKKLHSFLTRLADPHPNFEIPLFTLFFFSLYQQNLKRLCAPSTPAYDLTSLQIKDKRARVLEAVVALKQSASKSNAMDS
jgi:hypothetical protein